MLYAATYTCGVGGGSDEGRGVRVGFFAGGSPCVVVQLLEPKAMVSLQVDARVFSGVLDGHGWLRVAKLGLGYDIAAQAGVHPK